MRRMIPSRLLCVLFLLALAVPASLAAQKTECGADPRTGAPVPLKAPGLCLVAAGSPALMLRTAADGLLIIAPEEEAEPEAPWLIESSSALRLDNRDARLIYCPARTLNSRSGAPGPGCLSDFTTLTPGPAAFLGSGRASAVLAVSASGLARCPSSVQIIGEVLSPGGDAFDLSAHLALVAAAKQRGVCRPLGGQIDLTYVAPLDDEDSVSSDPEEQIPAELASRLAALGRLNEQQWALLDELLQLDDAQWLLLTQLLEIPADQLADLPSQSGEAQSLTDPGGGQSARRPSIRSLLNTITTKVESVTSRADVITDRLPDRSDIRALLDDIDLPRLREMLTTVRDEIGGVMETVEELRSGYTTFAGAGGSCGAGSECAVFKDQLRTVFADLRETWLAVQELGCLQNPLLSPEPMQTAFFESLLTDKAPLVVLYSLKRVLDQIDGWQSFIGDAVSEIPQSLRGFCGANIAQQAIQIPCTSSPNVVCCAMRDITESQLRIPRLVTKISKNLFSRIEEWTADDKVICANVVAVAGGGGGTNVKNPVNAVSKMIKNVSESLMDTLDQLIDRRQNCLDEDSDQERDLADCKLIVDYMLTKTEHGKFEELVEIYGMRVDDMECCVDSARILEARAAAGTAATQHAAGQRAEAFQTLCQAYRKLTGGTPGGGGPDSIVAR